MGHAFNGVHAERSVTPCKAWDQDVLDDREIGEDLGRLKHAADAHLIDFMRLAAQDALTFERDAAGIRCQLADEHVEKGRFARPVRPDDRVAGALFDAEVHIAQGLQPAEALVDVFDL